MNEFLQTVLENRYQVTIKYNHKLDGLTVEVAFGEKCAIRAIDKYEILNCQIDLLAEHMRAASKILADDMPNQDPRIGGIFHGDT